MTPSPYVGIVPNSCFLVKIWPQKDAPIIIYNTEVELHVIYLKTSNQIFLFEKKLAVPEKSN